jgi:predicted metal-dependent peptidase
MSIDERAAYRILMARSMLVKSRRFYGVLVSNVEPVKSRQFPTMATNGKQHFYNPEFVDGLTQVELEGVQVHETEHDARHHSTRRGYRDHEKWNIACDYAINIDLVDEGWTLPKCALIDPKYRGMSAEDIYRTRELDEQRNQPKPPEPEQPEDEPEDDESDGENEGDDESKPDEPDGDEPDSDDGDNDESDNDNGNDGEDDDNDEGSEEGEGEGDEADEEGDENGNAQGDGAEGDGEEDSSSGSGSADGGDDDASKQAQSHGDPGGCGEVIDAAEDVSENAELDAKWERITRQAVSLAKAIGQLPGHISRDIQKANEPGQDWRETLRAWFDQGALQTETWNRPNKRFCGAGLYLPGRARDGINKVAFLIDTSGSMDNIALKCVEKETQAALDDGVIDEAVIVYGDTQVNRVDSYRTGESIEFDPRGGGGTMLRPLFDYVAEQVDDAALLVVFTDMEFEDLNSTPAPHCPVLFAATGYPDKVRQYLANAPWDSPGIDVGEH